MILFLIFTLELLLGPEHNLKTCCGILHLYTSKPHNFLIIKTHTILFFLKHLRLESVGRADWPVTLWVQNPPLLRIYNKNENFFFGEWLILRALTSKEPSRDHQGQVSDIATRCSLTAKNAPQGPRSATRGGVGAAVLSTPRAISWQVHGGDEPEVSAVRLLASTTSAAWW